jgi:hypothetical protein
MNTPAPLAKIAEALGWMRAERNGVEIWRDPEGGYVVSAQLLEQMGEVVPRAIAEMKDQSKIDSLVVGKLQAQVVTATEDTALLNRWEKGQWLIGVSSTGEWQAMSQTPGLIGKGFVGKSVRDVLRQIRDLT